MRVVRAVALLLSLAASLRGNPLLPLKEGMTWEFLRTEQSGATREETPLTMRIAGTAERGADKLFVVETRAGEPLTKTELIGEDDSGVHIYERTPAGDKATIYKPPQTFVPAPLKIGASWEVDDYAAGTQMHQRWTVASEEVVGVPAGTYQAVRFHCEQPWPISIAIDRWFVPEVGVVKEVTSTRGPTGRLISRATTVLKKLLQTAPVAPGPTPEPEGTATAPPETSPTDSSSPAPLTADASAATTKVTLEVSSERDGEPRTDFATDTPNIFVRWAGEGLPVDATAHVLWIAEDVGDLAPANFVIDETATSINRGEFSARFTLSRPQDGWAAGKYRVELYFDDDLVQSLKVTIHD